MVHSHAGVESYELHITCRNTWFEANDEDRLRDWGEGEVFPPKTRASAPRMHHLHSHPSPWCRLTNLEATFKLFIGNLPPDPTVEMLQEMFAGREAQEFIPIKNKPGMPNLKGSAFVKMGR